MHHHSTGAPLPALFRVLRLTWPLLLSRQPQGKSISQFSNLGAALACWSDLTARSLALPWSDRPHYVIVDESGDLIVASAALLGLTPERNRNAIPVPSMN